MTVPSNDLPTHYSFLRQFYVAHFPIDELFKLLLISERREFAAQLDNQKIVRYMPFSTAEKLREWLLRTCPLKLDLGCEYKDSNMKAAGCLWREFVLDIDMSDYFKEENKIKKTKRDKKDKQEDIGESVPFQSDIFENVHFCGELCENCTFQMSQVIEVLYQILYHNLGFRRIIFFFSGNKGFHCYILDENVRHLSNYIRESIVIYLKSFGIIGDIAVSRDIRHLLKCPFVVHPKTGLICLPIIRNERDEMWEIDLLHVKDVVEGTYNMEKYVRYLQEFNNREN